MARAMGMLHSQPDSKEFLHITSTNMGRSTNGPVKSLAVSKCLQHNACRKEMCIAEHISSPALVTESPVEADRRMSFGTALASKLVSISGNEVCSPQYVSDVSSVAYRKHFAATLQNRQEGGTTGLDYRFISAG